MKKYLLTISALMLLVAGCEMFPPDDTSIAPDSVEAPAIAILSSGDSTFSATITPVEGTSYYSYVVMEAPRQTIDPDALYECDVTGAVLANYQETPVTNINLRGLSPNTLYYIYAVAGSQQGNPSAVAVDSVATSDGLAPTLGRGEDGYIVYEEDEDNAIFTVPYSEAIRKSGQGEATVIFYAEYAPDAPAAVVTVPDDSITVSGNNLIVSVPDPIPGAHTYLAWEDGLVVDYAGNAGEGCMSPEVHMQIPTQEWSIGYLVEVDADGDTTYNAADSTIYFTDASLFFTEFSLDKVPAAINEYVRITYTSTDGTVTSYDSDYFDLPSDGTVLVGLPRATTAGDFVQFTFPAGMFEDVYGNPNAEFTTDITYRHSFGYEIEDILGNYLGLGVSAANGSTYYLHGQNSSIVITAKDTTVSKLRCNVMIENFYRDGTKIYGQLDFITGELSIPDGQYLTKVTLQGYEGEYEVQFANYSEYAPVVFDMSQPGFLSSDDYYMYYLPDLNGYLNVFSYSELSRKDSGNTTSVAKSSQMSAPKEFEITEVHPHTR